MALYEVQVFCNICGEVHRMGLGFELDDGPSKRESIGDTYAGKELPPKIASLINNQMECPNTKKMFTQQDNKQVFLVPTR